jgi:ABC-type uncharacterized transport system ATPase subunit
MTFDGELQVHSGSRYSYCSVVGIDVVHQHFKLVSVMAFPHIGALEPPTLCQQFRTKRSTSLHIRHTGRLDLPNRLDCRVHDAAEEVWHA